MNEHPNSDAPRKKISDVRQVSGEEQFTPPFPKQREPFLIELFKFAFIAIVIVLPIRLFIAQPFIVSGGSMDPTFENGEYLIVDELSYRFEEPSRGDVIIFRFPQDPSKFFIKRVIGLPNETVTMENGTVTIVNQEHPEGIALDEAYIETMSKDRYKVSLGPDEYFVLGDNRRASSDSRVWGPLKEELIIGRAFLRLLPVARAAVLPGEYETQTY